MSTFSLALTQSLDRIIDYSTEEGHKYFKHAIEPLCDKLFDLSSEDKHLFTDLLIKRTNEIEWDLYDIGICTVYTVSLDPNSPTVNILINHGELSLDIIRDFEETYIASQSRAA